MDNPTQSAAVGEPGKVAEVMKKKEPTLNPYWKSWHLWVVVLRLLALCATISATLIMSLNKQSKTIAVATIGTSSIKATLEAKFQNTPAFVYFVIVNAIVSLHSLVILMLDLFGYKHGFKGLKILIMTLSDMTKIALLSSAVGAAASMSELGKNGNSHARWSKICDKFGTYCNRGGAALIVSFVGLILLMALNVLSTISIHKKTKTQSAAIP